MRAIILRVLCEGYSEQNFVSQLLAPYLRPKHVFAWAEPLTRGQFGIVPYDRLRKAIQADVGRSKSHQFVTTMIDPYKIGSFPEAAAKPNESPYTLVARIERGMETGLPGSKFIPYVQLHEFEALVLVDPSQIPLQFPGGAADGVPKKLRVSIGDTPPELVNDGEETAPSKRIIKAFPEYGRRKDQAGPLIAAAIGMARLREACAHFHDWLKRLDGLARRVALVDMASRKKYTKLVKYIT